MFFRVGTVIAVLTSVIIMSASFGGAIVSYNALSNKIDLVVLDLKDIKKDTSDIKVKLDVMDYRLTVVEKKVK